MIAVPSQPIRLNGGSRCGSWGCKAAIAETVAGVPLCASHLEQLRQELGASSSSVVYYVTWDEGATIKIGTSTNPTQRFREHAERTRATVRPLAAHPGGRQEERVQHRRFKHLLVPGERELFRSAPELEDHLEVIRRGWPDWEAILDRTSYAARRHNRRILT